MKQRQQSIAFVSILCLIVLGACRSLPKTQATQRAFVAIDVVNISRLETVTNTNQCLLIRACKAGEYNEGESIPCYLGLLNLETAKLVRIYRFEAIALRPERSLCSSEMEWSPDGTQFICAQGFMTSNGFKVFGIEGDERFSGKYSASWSSDGQYLLATTCQGSQGSPGGTITVYTTDTWEPICSVSASGDSLVCGYGGECQLPLSDGRTLWLQPGTNGFYYPRIFVCEPTGCPAMMPEPTYESVPHLEYFPSKSGRYRVYIEETGMLRLEDTEVDSIQIYGISGYRITEVAWRP